MTTTHERQRHTESIDLDHVAFHLDWEVTADMKGLDWHVYPVGGARFRDDLHGWVRDGHLSINSTERADLAAWVLTSPDHIRALAEAFDAVPLFAEHFAAVAAAQKAHPEQLSTVRRHGE